MTYPEYGHFFEFGGYIFYMGKVIYGEIEGFS